MFENLNCNWNGKQDNSNGNAHDGMMQTLIKQEAKQFGNVFILGMLQLCGCVV